MAHGENAERWGHAGTEYWKSRLHPQGETPGRFTKTQTHRKERREQLARIRAIRDEVGPVDIVILAELRKKGG